jgi:hypothetical protein
MTIQFAPSSVNFVKSKAKQLQRAFPGLQLSVAQEATSIALGYKSWFDLKSRVEGSPHGSAVFSEHLSDEDRIARRHHQFCALVDTAKLPPQLSAHFVRIWNLTAKDPAIHLNDFENPYNDILGMANDPDFEDHDYREATVVAPGICIGPIGYKYSYYALDCQAYNKLPPFFRSCTGTYIDFEGGKSLSLLLLNIDPNGEGLAKLNENPWHSSWLADTGPSPDSYQAKIRQDAIDHPNSFFALSVRMDFESADGPSSEFFVPAITGEQFVKFIDSKGDISIYDVRWFSGDFEAACNLSPIDFFMKCNLRLDLKLMKPCPPLFHWPFKFQPMSSSEYDCATDTNAYKTTEDELL